MNPHFSIPTALAYSVRYPSYPSVRLYAALLLVALTTWGCFGGGRSELTEQFFLKGKISLKQRRYGEAVRYFTEAIQRDTTYAAAYTNRGIALAGMADLNAAVSDYSTAYRHDSGEVNALYNRANAYYDMGRYESALADLTRVLRRKDSAYVYNNRGTVLQQLGKLAEAQQDFERALALNPALNDASTNLANLMLLGGNYSQAEQQFAKVLRRAPNDPYALNGMGMALLYQQEFAKATSALEKAVSLLPTQPYFLNNLGYCYLQQDRLEYAERYIRRSLQYDNTNALAHRNLGAFLLKAEQPGALEALDQAQTLDPDAELLYYYLGLAQLKERQNPSAACETWHKATAAYEQAQVAALIAVHCR